MRDRYGRLLYEIVSSTAAVSSINLRVDIHLCKLRPTPVARFYICIVFWSYMAVLFDCIGCGDSPRWGCVALPHPQGSPTKVISECPSRAYRMALKKCSDNEAVRSTG